MIETWVSEDGHELPSTPEAFLAETRQEIKRWNEIGRALCTAFLDVATS